MIPVADAAGNKQLEKAHKKEMKAKMKEYKKRAGSSSAAPVPSR